MFYTHFKALPGRALCTDGYSVVQCANPSNKNKIIIRSGPAWASGLLLVVVERGW